MSSELLVETGALTKVYGAVTAVKDLNLNVHRGQVYGFLGPNGAGKTTTLRMLLGLIRPTSGTARVAGYKPGSPAGLAQIGSLIETPAFYPYLSGRDNLRLLTRYAGVSEDRIDPALAKVDLGGRAKDKFKTYSLGMKQRLGVAAALLKDPELLILDEPSNGLDPQGMLEMRELLRGLGQGHRTVLISSHLLGEVEQICDRVGVIRHGQMVAEGTVTELRGAASGLLVQASPADAAQRILTGLLGADAIQTLDDGHLAISVEPARAAEINRALVNGGVNVSELRAHERSLEEAFLELTEGSVP